VKRASMSSRWLFAAAAALAVAACAPNSAGVRDNAPAEPASSAPKRITIAILSDPPVINAKLATGAGSWQGLGDVTSLVNVGMTSPDDRGSHFTLVANNTFAYGRPNVDEITVKFIADPRTLVANVLAGGVDLTLGRGLSIDQSLEIRDRWAEGRISVPAQSWLAAYPQFLNPNPAVVGNAQFRRALAYGTDRQQLADAIQAGLVPMAHSLLNPESAEYAAIQGSIVRYDFDPRRAAQLLDGLGFSRTQDGMFQDLLGQSLTVEIRAVPTDTATKTTLALADSWQRLGVGSEPNLMPPQLQRDLEYRANAPGFTILRNGASLTNLVRFHSNEAPLAQNGFIGENKARYMNAEFDAMIERYFVTIPLQERYRIAGQIIQHMTDIVLPLGLFYDSEPSMIGNRLRSFTPSKGEGGSSTWNAHAWAVTS